MQESEADLACKSVEARRKAESKDGQIFKYYKNKKGGSLAGPTKESAPFLFTTLLLLVVEMLLVVLFQLSLLIFEGLSCH